MSLILSLSHSFLLHLSHTLFSSNFIIMCIFMNVFFYLCHFIFSLFVSSYLYYSNLHILVIFDAIFCSFFTLFSSFSGMLPRSPEHTMIVQAVSCLAAFILFQKAGASSISEPLSNIRKPLSSISELLLASVSSFFIISTPLSTSG
jgi:hypothetical protein